MKRNFLLMLLLTLLPLAGWAEEEFTLTKDVGTEDALRAAFKNGGSIKLVDDIYIYDGQLVVPAGVSLTLDLNGKALSGPAQERRETGSEFDYADFTENTGIIRVQFGASLTVDDSSADGSGVIDGTFYNGFTTGIMMGQKAINPEYDGDLTATLVVNGGTIKGSLYGISGNGFTNPEATDKWKGQASITINGGQVLALADGVTYDGKKEYGTGIYQPGACELTVNGDEPYIFGEGTAVEVRAGKAVINGGSFESDYYPTDVTPNGNGTTTLGAAFAVAQHTTKQPITVTINGGTFEGYSALSVANPQENLPADFNVAVKVTGGEFEGKVIVAENVTDLVTPADDPVFDLLFIKGGYFKFEDPSVFVDLKNYIVLEENLFGDQYAIRQARVESTTQFGYGYRVIPRGDVTWTMDKEEGFYQAAPFDAGIKVSLTIDGETVVLKPAQFDEYGIVVKYYYGEGEKEVPSLYHAGEYIVKVGMMVDGEFVPFGDVDGKPFFMDKADLALRLGTIYPYFHQQGLKADYVMEGRLGGDDNNNTKVVNAKLVDLTKPEWWISTDDYEFIGWKKASEFDVRQIDLFALVGDSYPYGVINGQYAHVFVLDDGEVYEDYHPHFITPGQAELQSNILTVEIPEGLGKIYGDVDDLTSVVVTDQDGLDPNEYEENKDNKTENDIDVQIAVSREKTGKYEDAGSYDVYVDITGTAAVNFEVAGNYDYETEEIEGGTRYIFKDAFIIDQYDLSTDETIAAVDDDPETEDVDETVEGQTEKVIITIKDVVYDGTMQQVQPESVIFLDVNNVLAPVDGNPVTSNEYVEGTDELGAHVILANPVPATAAVEDDPETPDVDESVPGTDAVAGDWQRAYLKDDGVTGTQKTQVSAADAAAGKYTYYYNGYVDRNEDGTYNTKGECRIEATPDDYDTEEVEGAINFTGVKTGNFAVTPRIVKVQVAELKVGFNTPETDLNFQLEEVETPDDDTDGFVFDNIWNNFTGRQDNVENNNLKKPYVVFTIAPEYTGAIGTYTATADLTADAKATKRKTVAKNYEVVFVENKDNLKVGEVEVELAAVDQTGDYPEPVVGTPNAYKLPIASKGKTQGTWEWVVTDETIYVPAVEDDPETTDVDESQPASGTIKLTGTLPAGVQLSDIVTLTCDITKVGTTEGALVLTEIPVEERTSDAAKAVNIKKITNGNLTINQLQDLYLSYDNIEQALEDHQENTVNVYLPSRKLKTDLWYSMVLPFDFYVPTFSNKLNYAAVALLNKKVTGSDVHFNTFVGTVAANTPFLFKVAPEETNSSATITWEAADLATVHFDGVKIGKQKYNGGATDDPYVEDVAHHKFIGTYKTVDYLENKGGLIAKVGMEPNEWFVSTGDGNFYRGNEANKNHNILTTEAYLSFPGTYEARIFIDDEDGNATAIHGIGAEPDEIATSGKSAADGIYDLSGRRVNKAQKGIYIQNGKKVLVK